LPFLATVVAVVVACDSESSFVARAGEQQWDVEEAAALVAPRTDLPASPDVIRALANLWVDYVLLATAAAEDTTLSQVDVSAVVQELTDDRLIGALRDSVLTPDSLTTAQARALYNREGPGSVVRASHILFAWPRGATAQQRDSVRSALTALRSEITSGRLQFAAAAQQHSNDTASARQGGAIGTITRGQLVKPLEDAAFSLPANGISQPVESPYGLHLVRVDERITPTWQQFRLLLAQRHAARAESTYVATLAAAAVPHVEEGAAERVRQLARNPRTTLDRGDRTRALLTYRGGEITTGEALRHIQQLPPDARNQIAQAYDDSIPARVVLGLAHRELLLAEVARRGWSVREDVRAPLATAARRNLAEAARQLGLMPDQIEGGNADESDIKAAASGLLSRMLAGEVREITPLGAMSYVLRGSYPVQISEEGINAAVQRTTEMRAEKPAPAQ
jgi:hypothetical protein